jgi:hypothetical protein
MKQTSSAFESLTPDQRVRVGSIAMLAGIALIGVLTFAPAPWRALQVGGGVASVAVMVVGVLLIGTSEKTV